MQPNKKIVGIFFLLITAIIWGGSFVSQLCGITIGSHVFNASRCIFSCATCFIIIVINNLMIEHRITLFKRTDDIKKTIRNSVICGLTLFFGFYTQQIGAEKTTIAKAGLISALEAIVVPIILFIFYKRKIRFITWIFIVTAMIGIMLLSANSISGFNIGDFFVFISTIFYSITIIQIPKYVNDIDPFLFSFFRLLTVGIISVVCALIFEYNKINFHAIKNAMPSILYAGVLSSGIAYIFQILGQKNCDPIIATLIMCLEGVFAAIFGWVLLGQTLNYIQIIGVLLSFISIVVVQLTENRSV